MEERIVNLFNDIKKFGNIMANINLSKLSIKLYKSEYQRMIGTLVIADLKQFKNIEECFVALFKKYIYDGEEWNDSDWNDAIEEEWIKSLEQYWMPYYTFNFKNLHINTLDPEKFITRFEGDFTSAGMDKECINKWIKEFNNLKVLQIQKAHVYYHVFGLTDESCFLFDWGIWD